MKIKVSDYIAQKLVAYGIRHVFTVTGGGAMHLNDAFGHQKGLACIYQHHEQACAIAAESYARIENRMAAVCVTTGPGGTNALTGVLGSWLDSIPMLVISGQVRYNMTARSTGFAIRAFGDQEFDIVKVAGCMTKYAVMVTDPATIRMHLEKAVFLAQSGRPGPCWLDIPLDVQSAYVETDSLAAYDPAQDQAQIAPKATDAVAVKILEKLKQAQRPVFNAGNGIRIAGAEGLFLKVAGKLGVPVVTGWNSIDLIPDDHPLYTGRAGIMGDRPGNWAVQCSDVLLSVGSRLSIRQVGYDYTSWAAQAYTIVEDVDAGELKKPTVRVDLPVWADARDFLEALDRNLVDTEQPWCGVSAWVTRCQNWKKDYPVVQEHHFQVREQANVYAFIKSLGMEAKEGQITVVGNGSACVVGSQAFVIKKGQRFIINSAVASMGYDLPAAIGACMAAGRLPVICITGDGSIQMNLQELQTIIHHRLPVKLFVINNNGYHSIRQTQKNFFEEPLVGIGADSGDLSFPSMEKLAAAYGYPYYKISHNGQMDRIGDVLAAEGPCICEVFVDIQQRFEPKAETRRMPDGTLVSASLENLAPCFTAEELERIIGG